MKKTILCLAVFTTVLVTHFLSKTVTITDSVWALPLALSIEREHNTSLNEYQQFIHDKEYYAITYEDSQSHYFLPLGTSLLIAPVVKGIDIISTHMFSKDIRGGICCGYSHGIELFLASLLMALASVLIFLVGIEVTHSNWQALVGVFVFAFCTSVWSTASRALWSHTGSIFMLSLVLYAVLKARQNYKWLLLVGLALAYSYVVRPTNSLPILFFTFYMLYAYPKRFYVYVAGLVLVFVPFLFYNWQTYNQILSPYYLPSGLKVGGNTFLLEGLGVNLISPGRGLLVFSPVLLFALVGGIIVLVNKKFTLLHTTVAVCIAAHYYVISSITTPYAGWSFGPRYFSDMMPFFIYFLLYFIQYLSALKPSLSKKIVTILFAISLGISFFINYKGATEPATFFAWNAEPNIVDHPEHAWSWTDLQFLR